LSHFSDANIIHISLKSHFAILILGFFAEIVLLFTKGAYLWAATKDAKSLMPPYSSCYSSCTIPRLSNNK